MLQQTKNSKSNAPDDAKILTNIPGASPRQQQQPPLVDICNACPATELPHKHPLEKYKNYNDALEHY